MILDSIVLQAQTFLGYDLHVWGIVLARIAIAGVIGAAVYLIISRSLARVIRRTTWGLDEILLLRLRPAMRIAIPVLFMLAATTHVQEDVAHPLPVLQRLLVLAAIGCLTWLAAALIGALAEVLQRRYDVTLADNREARRIHTQVTVLGRSLQTLAIIIGIAAALMTFPRVQQIGTGLLASAGIVGLIVGLAARPMLENLIAGLQIGFTQPIRLDDVVSLEGEFGRIEEITLTYVVVRIWDDRRLVVPLSRFLTTPFQNWTRTTSQILAPVFVWVDYAAPIEQIRAQAERIVRDAKDWDGRVVNLQVTDTTDRAVQLRVLASAGSASQAWDLRVHIRERLIAWLQREHPDVLPKFRVGPLDKIGEEKPGSAKSAKSAKMRQEGD